MNAMAVTIFDRGADAEAFDGWVRDVRSAAQDAPGFVAFATSSRRDAPLDWAVAVTFESEDSLHQWLDGATW
jgi:antibiotic biosynthesis monooxygenase (ABM) superfamily enzyme